MASKRFTIKDSKKFSINLPCARFRCRECGAMVYGEVMNFTNEESRQLWLGGNHEGNPAGPLCVGCTGAKKFSRTEMGFGS